MENEKGKVRVVAHTKILKYNEGDTKPFEVVEDSIMHSDQEAINLLKRSGIDVSNLCR